MRPAPQEDLPVQYTQRLVMEQQGKSPERLEVEKKVVQKAEYHWLPLGVQRLQAQLLGRHQTLRLISRHLSLSPPVEKALVDPDQEEVLESMHFPGSKLVTDQYCSEQEKYRWTEKAVCQRCVSPRWQSLIAECKAAFAACSPVPGQLLSPCQRNFFTWKMRGQSATEMFARDGLLEQVSSEHGVSVARLNETPRQTRDRLIGKFNKAENQAGVQKFVDWEYAQEQRAGSSASTQAKREAVLEGLKELEEDIAKANTESSLPPLEAFVLDDRKLREANFVPMTSVQASTSPFYGATWPFGIYPYQTMAIAQPGRQDADSKFKWGQILLGEVMPAAMVNASEKKNFLPTKWYKVTYQGRGGEKKWGYIPNMLMDTGPQKDTNHNPKPSYRYVRVTCPLGEYDDTAPATPGAKFVANLRRAMPMSRPDDDIPISVIESMCYQEPWNQRERVCKGVVAFMKEDPTVYNQSGWPRETVTEAQILKACAQPGLHCGFEEEDLRSPAFRKEPPQGLGKRPGGFRLDAQIPFWFDSEHSQECQQFGDPQERTVPGYYRFSSSTTEPGIPCSLYPGAECLVYQESLGTCRCGIRLAQPSSDTGSVRVCPPATRPGDT